MVDRRKHVVEVGQVFGNLTVIETDLRLPNVRQDRKSRVGERAAMVRCVCGDERLVKLTNLVSPKSSIQSCRSCGVQFRGTARTESVYYNLWRNTRNRCTDPNYPGYSKYGGRGIAIAPEWAEFEEFRDGLIEDIGPRPTGTTLGRIDADGHYEPGNVCWETREQSAAKRRAVKEN